jgi:hypothetical protein
VLPPPFFFFLLLLLLLFLLRTPPLASRWHPLSLAGSLTRRRLLPRQPRLGVSKVWPLGMWRCASRR